MLAVDNLIFAGTPDLVPGEDPLAALEGRMGGVIKVVSSKVGLQKAENKLHSPPVFDGLSAAGGRLFITTRNGEKICMGQR